MPKLIVIVEKDSNGKIWNYSFTPEQWKNMKENYGQSAISIHKLPKTQQPTGKLVKPTKQKEVLTFEMIPPHQEKVKAKKTKP